MIEYETRIIKVVVSPKGEPLMSERATLIEIMDDGGGEFLSITQDGGHTEYSKSILINKEEWPSIRAEVDKMMSMCRSES